MGHAEVEISMPRYKMRLPLKCPLSDRALAMVFPNAPALALSQHYHPEEYVGPTYTEITAWECYKALASGGP